MIFFAKKRIGLTFNNKTTIKLEPYQNCRYGSLLFSEAPEKHNFSIYGLNNLYFKSIEDFYKYASKFDGISIPEEVIKKKAFLQSGSVNEFHNAKLDSFMVWQYQLLEYAKQNKKNQANLKSTSADNDLTLSIQNQKITGSSTMYFEFDVYAKANNSNTYYSNAIARIDFNTAIFGLNLEASGNITLTRGSSFSSSTYETSVYDVSSSRVNIGLTEKYNLTSWNRTKLTTSPVQLLHVIIEILPSAIDGNANITFQEIDFSW